MPAQTPRDDLPGLQAPGEVVMKHAAYDIVRVASPFVWIKDLDQGLTVTNDAENVVRVVLSRYPGHRIIYQDTEGQWDELRHDGAKFTGFAPAAHLPAPQSTFNGRPIERVCPACSVKHQGPWQMCSACKRASDRGE